MLRSLRNILFLLVLAIFGALGLYVYHYHTTAEYEAQVKIKQLEDEKREAEEKRQAAEQMVSRLEASRRVARIIVTKQVLEAGKVKSTTLLFEDYRRDGTAMPGRVFTIAGNEAHFDAEIIKFKDEYVKAGDPLRGHSIMLFTRVYGATQAPADGYVIDEPGQIPEIYRGVDPRVTAFEQDLWKNFWTLYNDQAARDARGIRGLHGEGLFGRFDMDHVYTITLRPDGGTLEEAPIDPIYADVLKGN